jgi:putative MATE family efflux protein
MDSTIQRTDLTNGSITKKLVSFALPILADYIVMQLYNVADAIVVGQFIGSDALAAVMVGFPILMMSYALLMGLSIGANVLVAQYKGAGELNKLRRTVETIYSLSFYIGILMAAGGVFAVRPLLMLLDTPDNILNDAVLYLQIVIGGGILGNILFYLGEGIIRGMGDSHWPLIFTTLASVINIILNLVFVLLFGWGIVGVALGTSIAFTFSGIVLLVRLLRGKYGIYISLSGLLKIDRHISVLIFKYGIPPSIQSVVITFGMFFIQAYSNIFGSDFIAANAIIMRVDGFAVMPMFGINAAITTFVGQNIGAGKLERAKEGIFKSIQITFTMTLFVGTILFFWGTYLMRAFTDNVSVLEMGTNGLRFLAFFYVFMGVSMCIGGSVRGAGEANAPAIIEIASSAVRILSAYFLAVLPFNYMGLFHSMGISMAFGFVIFLAYFKFGRWQTKSIK